MAVLRFIAGLPEATANPDSNVSCIYTFDTVAKTFPTIQRLRSGQARNTGSGKRRGAKDGDAPASKPSGGAA